jgi:hypothetical protein
VSHRQRDADRLLRAQGNQAGRARLSTDGTLHPATAPRALIVSTGEDVPRGRSLRARILVLEMGPDALNWDVLGTCQRQAACGLYAAALAGYLQRLARRYDRIARMRRHWLARLRHLAGVAGHKRTPEGVANLLIGLHLALGYGRAIGELSVGEARTLWHEGWSALRLLGIRQPPHHDVADPAGRFLDLLRGAIASGAAHVATGTGGFPGAPQTWGWSQGSAGSLGDRSEEWIPRGTRVGWVDGADLYLDLDRSYEASRECGRRVGEPPALSVRTVCKRMAQQNLLVTVDPARETLTVRRVLEGLRRNVLHLDTETLIDPHAFDQPDHVHVRSIRIAEPAPRRPHAPRTARIPKNDGQFGQVEGVTGRASEKSTGATHRPGRSSGPKNDAVVTRPGDEISPRHHERPAAIQLDLHHDP